jgi:transcriptional regulator with PAS, ATPase and Fis domain
VAYLLNLEVEVNIKLWAELDKNILLLGETGTGKSTLAKRIHQESTRHEELFHKVNLATLSDNLLESELFGHKKGSFTGAYKDKIGHCQAVANGTLFLDEIGELSANGQKKLLSLLEEGTFTPVGSTDVIKFRGRVIAATNKDLEMEVSKGNFREDLYFRLLTFSHKLKPIRENKMKIDEILSLKKFEYKSNGKEKKLTPDLKFFLKSYSWPGNIRQLISCLDYLYLMSGDETIGKEHLPQWVCINDLVEAPVALYKNALESFEKQYLTAMLEKNDGKVNQTSRNIQISKSTLIAKIRKYGINTTFIKYQNYSKAPLQLIA